MRVLFCHGLEGTPHGTKVRAMRTAGLDVLAPDFQGQVLAERIQTLGAVLAELPADAKMILAGSSYGGAVAAWTAMHHTDRFAGLLLLAPALHYAEQPVASAVDYIPVDLPTIIIHGEQDSVVPISASEDYAGRSTHVQLRRVEDGHRLVESLPEIISAVRELIP